MAPTLILIRHAQALHNVASDYSLPDPPLSGLGHEQCKKLADHLQVEQPLAAKIEYIVTSPMRRTLQTTQESLGWVIGKGIRVEADARWQGELWKFPGYSSAIEQPDFERGRKESRANDHSMTTIGNWAA